MRYKIEINQLALVELESKITLEEAVLLDYLYWLCSSPSVSVEKMRIEKEEKKYTWFDYRSYLEETPMLRGKTTGTVSPKIHKLTQEGFIEVILWKGKRKYIRLLPKTDLLYRKAQEPELRKLNSRIEITKDQSLDNSMYNNNKDNVNKNKSIRTSLFEKKDIEEIFSSFKDKILPGCRLTTPAADAIKKALNWYTKQELMNCIDNMSKDDWWMEKNSKRGHVWFFGTKKILDQLLYLQPTLERKAGITILK